MTGHVLPKVGRDSKGDIRVVCIIRSGRGLMIELSGSESRTVCVKPSKISFEDCGRYKDD